MPPRDIPRDTDELVSEMFRQRYELLDPIGEGAMGMVYRAVDKRCDRIVAVKVLHSALLSEHSWIKRFYREARACARLQHPNTILVLDCGVTDRGLPFIAMEYLGGRSLRDVIASEGRIDPVRVVKIMAQCCASLVEAHGHGIVHRDIKPENVFLMDHFGSPDHVKVLDFSIAKIALESVGRALTLPGQVLGTPEYMSPDHVSGGGLDARSDIYSLGVVAYEMLAGRCPYENPNPIQTLRMHAVDPIPPLPANIPYEVAGIVLRAMHKPRELRYQTAIEMLAHCIDVLGRPESQTGHLRAG